MRVLTHLLFTSLVFLSTTVSSFAALPDVRGVTAKLTAAAVRPNPGAVEASGVARIAIMSTTAHFTFHVQLNGVSDATMHIHRGARGVNGPVVAEIPNLVLQNGIASGSGAATTAIIDEMYWNPTAFYVDLHSSKHPEGALRGQLDDPAGSDLFSAGPLTGVSSGSEPGDPDGIGYAMLDLEDDTVTYTLIAANVNGPTTAHVHGGGGDGTRTAIDLKPTFVNGVARGSVIADPLRLLQIRNAATEFYVDVHTTDFPEGAMRAPLRRGGLEEQVLPVVGRAAGANGTFFRTDFSVVNPSEFATMADLHYYATGHTGIESPTASLAVLLAPHEQRTFSGDELQAAFSTGDGAGAIIIQSPHQVRSVARVYNDQRSAQKGTFSQYVRAQKRINAPLSGLLPMLANQQGNTGYRTNIGWFNAHVSAASVTFSAHRPNGTVLASVTRDIPAGQQAQVSLNALFPTLEPLDTLYVTYLSTTPLVVYASVVDNVNGDAIFVSTEEP